MISASALNIEPAKPRSALDSTAFAASRELFYGLHSRHMETGSDSYVAVHSKQAC